MIIFRLQLQPDHWVVPGLLLHLQMRHSLLTRLFLQKTSRTFHGNAKSWGPEHLNPADPHEVSKWRALLKKELAIKVAEERKTACIYRVPVNMREVQPEAYAPRIISIGPYHHGEGRLREMEELKWEFFHRLFRPKRPNGVELDKVMNSVQELEQVARGCYWDKAEQHSKDKFVKMMLVDGCFIVELFRELKQNNFHYARSVKRWMLPTLRRDLIMLENQLPLFVLQTLFDLTRRSGESTTSLGELALRFFNPLLQRESDSDVTSSSSAERQHFLDLFRLSILPRCLSEAEETGKAAKSTTEEGINGEETGKTSDYRKAAENITEEGIKTSKTSDSSKAAMNTAEEGISGAETDMMRSMTELMEAGVIIEKGVNCPPLDVRSEGRFLKIPPLYIDDYKGTLFRNLVAYEQCHPQCKPDVTSYLFFFDGLINSAHDVELLHHKGVLHHSLGNNKEVARLVNGLCKEIARDARESYLHEVVSDVNSYYDTIYARIRARLVHHYFSSWVVGISTFGAVIVLYLTLIQTGYGYVDDPQKLEKPFHHYLVDCLSLPVYHLFTFSNNQMNSMPESIDDSVIGHHWMLLI
ncbi:UPF0481 protein At3g47200-like [Herrania umbratica]|uniref:UPF0481 protein At3g47200-like n=1 Tax=Herrania umbratica TaxID=108875 RepID=A0A6J1AH75_9ROSI|nr:UPF0481 protein At3g47200-like [Herrania umbratica]